MAEMINPLKLVYVVICHLKRDETEGLIGKHVQS
jgi:hypothetical protein